MIAAGSMMMGECRCDTPLQNSYFIFSNQPRRNISRDSKTTKVECIINYF